MRASKFNIEKLLRIFALIQNNITVKEACHLESISPATYYSWRRILYLRFLSQENNQLKLKPIKKASKLRGKAANIKSSKKERFPDKNPPPTPDDEKALLDLLAEIIVDIIIRETNQ